MIKDDEFLKLVEEYQYSYKREKLSKEKYFPVVHVLFYDYKRIQNHLKKFTIHRKV